MQPGNLPEQPLNQLMIKLGLDNHALVQASKEQLTHKAVAKARKGRPLTYSMQMKILRAFNGLGLNEIYGFEHLFTYQGR